MEAVRVAVDDHGIDGRAAGQDVEIGRIDAAAGDSTREHVLGPAGDQRAADDSAGIYVLGAADEAEADHARAEDRAGDGSAAVDVLDAAAQQDGADRRALDVLDA